MSTQSWSVGIWVPLSGYRLKCSICLRRMNAGEPVVFLNKGTKTHRICLKKFLERSFYDLPPTPLERHDPTAGYIDTEKAQREFDEFRDGLLERYGVSDA